MNDYRMIVYRSMTDSQLRTYRCPAGLLIDDVQAGRDPRQTGSYSWFRNHSAGLGEAPSLVNGCAMGPGIRMDPQPPWNQHYLIHEGCTTENECEAADQAHETNRELTNECAQHPVVCILDPPNRPGGTLPNGPDGPRPCGFPGGFGGFEGCSGVDIDSLNEGPNATYIERYSHTNSSVTVMCIEL